MMFDSEVLLEVNSVYSSDDNHNKHFYTDKKELND